MEEESSQVPQLKTETGSAAQKDHSQPTLLDKLTNARLSGASPREILEDFAGRNETMEQKRDRVDGLWAEYGKVEGNSELMSLFDRKKGLISQKDPATLLRENGYPPRTKATELNLPAWKVGFNQKFVKDGYIYLLRGDHPGQENKGLYSRPFAYGKKTTEHLSHDLGAPDEVGYFLYGDERYLSAAKPKTGSVVEELAYDQSAKGGSSFVSTTTNLETAIAGTGNQPDVTEQSQYEVYVIKVPVADVLRRPDNLNQFGLNEEEYLVPDYIPPNEVVAKFPRDQKDAIYNYFQAELGLTREDLGVAA